MEHEQFMQRCIALAQNGLGTTYPNPLVGSVVVHEGKIIGEGWHRKAGTGHAEVHAIDSVRDKSLLSGSIIYVNLEPCSHFGKTPPCADLIIRSKIPKVVIGNVDPNPVVSSNGIRKLQDAGIEVLNGILEEKCRNLNRRFFTFHQEKRPFVILKWAQSADGFFAPEINSGPHWISGKLSRQLVHRMRSEERAILVGTKTAIADNPWLNVRDWTGNAPIKIAIDRQRRISPENHIFENGETIVFSEKPGVGQTELIDFTGDVPRQILERLYQRGISSVIIEGGAFTIAQFVQGGFWDEARIFCGPNLLNHGIKAPTVIGKTISRTSVGSDQLLIISK